MMNTIMYKGVKLSFPDEMDGNEAQVYAADEMIQWEKECKKLGEIVVSIDGEEVEIKGFEKSPIQRLRRITGYISNINNFNDAKLEEAAERQVHVK